MILAILSLAQENVPLFDVTVIEFIIGFLALFLAVWLAFWIWSKVKGA